MLDRCHLEKYVLKAKGHLPKMRFYLYDGLNKCNLEQVDSVFKEIIENTKKETKLKAARECSVNIYYKIGVKLLDIIKIHMH
jgi:hypothetical protein